MSSSEVVEAVALIHRGAATLAELDLADLPDSALLESVREVETVYRQICAQRSRLFDSVHRRGAGRHDGAPSTQAWLRSRLRLGDAARQLRIGGTARTVPEVGDAYARGEISGDHLAVIAKVVPDIDPDILAAGAGKLLADQATEHTPQGLERVAAHVRDHFNPDAADRRARDHHVGRRLNASKTFEGAVAIDGLLERDAGELFLRTLGALINPPQPGDERTPTQRRADALGDMCRLAAQGAPTAGGEKPHVAVTIDWPTLSGAATMTGSTNTPAADGAAGMADGAPTAGDTTGGAPQADDTSGDAAVPGPPATGASPTNCPAPALCLSSGARLGDGTPLHPETARRLACDATILPAILGTASEVLDLGRTARLVSAAQRRALILRDGGCRFPGCDRPPQWADVHHLIHWALGGRTDLNGLILLCRWHHTSVHEGQWQITYDPTTNITTAIRPNGQPLDIIGRPRTHPP